MTKSTLQSSSRLAASFLVQAVQLGPKAMYWDSVFPLSPHPSTALVLVRRSASEHGAHNASGTKTATAQVQTEEP